MWKIYYTKQAQKDAKNLDAGNLKPKGKQLPMLNSMQNVAC